jgi:hypothetical protein
LSKFITSLCLLLSTCVAQQALAKERTLPEFSGLNQAQKEKAIAFIDGATTSVLFHEAGHLMVHEFSLPLIGLEEDEVDVFATTTLLQLNDKKFDQALIDTANAWFLWSEAAQAAGVEAPFWTEHSASEDRGYSTVCLMFGRDAKIFKDVADSVGLPEGRRENCAYEYETAVNAWRTILEPYKSSNVQQSNFEIVYDEPNSEDMADYAEFFRNSKLLETLETTIASKYKFIKGIKLRAASCGTANAYWDQQKREVLFCYEMTRFFASLLSSELATQSDMKD